MAGKAKSTVEISVSCTKLKNKDIGSKSDPCCVMYIRDDDEWKEIGRTETIQNNLNPQFSRHFEVEYEFEEEQYVRFEVYDIDNASEKLTDDDFLGQIETTLAEIVSTSPMTLPLIAKKKGKPAGGTITLTTKESSGGKQKTLKMLFKGEKLENKDRMGKSDPLLEFSRKVDGDRWQVVHKTEVINNNLNPTWRPFVIKISQLCAGDYDDPIKVDCKDYDSVSKQELIGTFITSVNELLKHPKGQRWACINPAKEGKKKYENSGTIILEYCELQD